MFNKGHVFPFSKMLTFYRKDNLILEASYSNPIPHTQTVIGWSTDCVVEFHVKFSNFNDLFCEWSVR